MNTSNSGKKLIFFKIIMVYIYTNMDKWHRGYIIKETVNRNGGEY